ncbi:hypothetical protein WJ35_04265 [Burkholderia ubonensis]|uniref:Uncharacterized protein n=1 Tax=Burkholderia ubonensis TaxID=101571 RepID=A0A1B4LB20_9BURK|nr:hypothetical protein WJ35_04265 [Burkholderia ubonensis]AOK10062.1 hypothetical protein WK31_07280 [Burkholderia vietnamiensis]
MHGVLIVVTLISGKGKASFVVKHPKGNVSPAKEVEIDHYLEAGLSERDALSEVLKIVKGVIESAHAAGIY